MNPAQNKVFNIDTVQDKIFAGGGISLKVNLKLYHQSLRSSSMLRYFYNEYMRVAKVGGQQMNSTMIQRDIDAYATLTIKDYTNNVDAYVNIFSKNMLELQAVTQFFITRFASGFTVYKNGKIKVNQDANSEAKIELYKDKWISYQLVVMYNDINSTYEKAVRIRINDNMNYVDLDRNNFNGLAYYILNLNLHQAALSMISSLPIELGTNRNIIASGGYKDDRYGTSSFDDDIIYEEAIQETGKKKNTIADQLKRSAAKDKELTLEDMG